MIRIILEVTFEGMHYLFRKAHNIDNKWYKNNNTNTTANNKILHS